MPNINELATQISKLLTAGMSKGAEVVGTASKTVGESDVGSALTGGATSFGEELGKTWQQQLAQTVHDSTLKAVAKHTENSVISGQVNPEELLAGSSQLMQGPTPTFAGSVPMTMTQQGQQFNPDIQSQINAAGGQAATQNYQPQKPGFWDYFFHTPKLIAADSYARASGEKYGELGPTVQAEYMRQQLPLSTEQAIQIPAEIAEKQAQLINTARGQMVDLAKTAAPFAMPGFKYFGQRPEEYSQATKNIEGINKAFETPIKALTGARERIASGGKAAQEITATNPKTGQKIVLRGGKWQVEK